MNILLATDSYKLGHMRMYPKDTVEVYSYLEARKPGQQLVWFGLQYILKRYLSNPVSVDDAFEFFAYYREILGEVPKDVKNKILALVDRGYWPIEIKSIPEGAVLPTGNVLMTIKNTHPDFYWCVGFLESLLLKVWYPTTVATHSLKYLKLVTKFAEETCDNFDHIPFQVHDFGYRGVSSEESAQIAGAAHLLNFSGSDTICANKFLDDYYFAKGMAKGTSIPASEHSVMCSYGKEDEFKAFDSILDLYPTGIVSLVSDSYDYWNVIKEYCSSRKDKIMARDGKTVLRPDSGQPIDIICGTHNHQDDRPYLESEAGSIRALYKIFGGTLNSKGYRVLDSHVGLIYGDGMHYDRFKQILERMKLQGYASSNLVIGVGGLLLQNHNRDELGFAIKATRIKKSDGSTLEIFKDPATDPGKRSKKGLMQLYNEPGNIYTKDQLSDSQEANEGVLKTVFKNGTILRDNDLESIKENIVLYD